MEPNLEVGLVGTEPYRVAQTWTAGTAGGLSGLSFLVSANGPALPAFLEVRCLEVDPAWGPGPVLGTACWTPLELPTRADPGWRRVDFGAAGLGLVAGKTYAVTLDPLGGNVSWHGTAEGNGGVSTAYAEGEMWETFDRGLSWRRVGASDLGFRVEVLPEPAPVRLLLVGLGCAAFGNPSAWASNRSARGRSTSLHPGR